MRILHIKREHNKSLEQARAIAKQWQIDGEQTWQLTCDYREGQTQDVLNFKRSGLCGHVLIDADKFEINIELGFLLRPYASRIKEALMKNLDSLHLDK